jgi:hypothetical protein
MTAPPTTASVAGCKGSLWEATPVPGGAFVEPVVEADLTLLDRDCPLITSRQMYQVVDNVRDSSIVTRYGTE